MSMWAGIANAYKDAEAARERQAERDYRTSRDEIADERYNQEISYRDKRDSIEDKRYNDKLISERMEKLIEAGLSPASTRSSGKSGRSTPTAQDLIESSERLAYRIGEEIEDPIIEDWFNRTNPAHHDAALKHAKAVEAATGEPYDWTNLPMDFAIISETGGNVDEINEAIRNGTLNVGDTETYLSTLGNIRVPRTTVAEPVAPKATDLTERAKAEEGILTMVARMGLQAADDSELYAYADAYGAEPNPANAHAMIQAAQKAGVLDRVIQSNVKFKQYGPELFSPYFADEPLGEPAVATETAVEPEITPVTGGQAVEMGEVTPEFVDPSQAPDFVPADEEALARNFDALSRQGNLEPVVKAYLEGRMAKSDVERLDNRLGGAGAFAYMVKLLELGQEASRGDRKKEVSVVKPTGPAVGVDEGSRGARSERRGAERAPVEVGETPEKRGSRKDRRAK